jgi:hypothetical protein
VKNILHDLKSKNPQLSYLNYDFIRITHEQSPEKYLKLLDVLKTKKLVLVGPQHLEKLSKFFTFTHISIPTTNCYLAKQEIINAIESINKSGNDNYYLFSASMATNVIIVYFKNDNKITYLDWGSVWDTFFISPEYGFIVKRTTSNLQKYNEIYKNYLI